ncbi:pre-mRNA-splicing factor SF2, partial [Achlya hypogyna]
MTTRIYVGNLPMDVRTREIDDLFYKYGRIVDIDVKFPSRPPAFAFVEFEDERDAEDAIRGRDGYRFEGGRLRVEPTRGGFRSDRPRDDRRSTPYGRNLPGSGKYCLDVDNLPEGCSWQDLKDHMRAAGDVIFTKVHSRGGGFVEFSNQEDKDKALSTLDGSEMKCKM